MEISVVAAARPGRPAHEDLDVGIVADRLGYAEVWIGEGFVWDSFALATAIGCATERIALTVGPLPVSVRDPATIARGAASIAALTGRRVGVALGTSSVRVVERMHGRTRERPVATLAESATSVRAMFDAGQTRVDGQVVAAHGYRLALPSPGGPLTIAAFGDRAIRVAAEHADRMLLDLVSPELAATYRAKLDAAARQAGRPAPRLAAWIPAAVDPGPAAHAQIMASLAGYLTVAGYGEMFTAAGYGEAVERAQGGADPAGLLPPEAPYRLGLVGALDAVRKRLDEYAAAGLDEVALVPATDGDPGAERTLTAIARLR